MKIEYKTIDTSTLKGLKEAERLHVNGWTTYRVGLFLSNSIAGKVNHD